MFRKTLVITALSASLFSLNSAQAHDGAMGVVKERMDLMKIIAKNTKAIAPIAMGSADMDLKAVETGAMAIQQAAKKVILKFPEGSISDVSEATPNIWTDWEKFVGQMRSLSEDAGGLAQLARDEEDFELTDAFIKMSNNCKQCHTNFRKKKE
ncbi:cytochrome c [Terasakiella sp. A23]|uniref:c-type cytochrome n=1 Tax=Terasakiella sp. FCG-A23 TaxID=3080561 RepID=UPI00295427CB|nr:cytochrome c [Terasakiella sp. A23]MDV7339785.1 cytochrome c [Terasakiella sp. A23]